MLLQGVETDGASPDERALPQSNPQLVLREGQTGLLMIGPPLNETDSGNVDVDTQERVEEPRPGQVSPRPITRVQWLRFVFVPVAGGSAFSSLRLAASA